MNICLPSPLRVFAARILCFLGMLFTSMASAADTALAGFKLEGTKWSYTDGTTTMSGVLFKPEGNGPFPAILISHGRGGNAEGFSASKARDFVKMGFVCIAPTYTHSGPVGGANAEEGARGKKGTAPGAKKGPGANPGAGKSAPDPALAATFGASEENLRRASKCLDILASLPYVDAKRLAAYGNSMGAFITVSLGTKEAARLKATAITAGGVSSRSSFATEAQAEDARVPICILHGTADNVVPSESSAKLKEILDRKQVPNERHMFEGVGHNLHQQNAEECYKFMRAWFVKYGVLPQ